jgi:polyphosphate kinase
VPIEDARLRAEVEDTLERCLADDTFSWELGPDDTWQRRHGGQRNAQLELMTRASERASVE